MTTKETFAQAVERLKKNEKPYRIFDDMPEKDQEILKQLKDECEVLEEFPDQVYWRGKEIRKLCLLGIYRIRPDYQLESPKPEYVDLKIEERSGWLGVSQDDYGIIPYDFQNLHALTSLPDFAGFYVPDEVPLCDARIDPDYVAERIHKGHKVIARFRR